MMADRYTICLIGVMDHLWFHNIILFSQPNSMQVSKTLLTKTPFEEIAESSTNESSMASSVTSSTEFAPLQDDSSGKEEECEKEIEFKERLTRLNNRSSKIRSHSSSPSTKERSRSLRYSSPVTRSEKTMSCKTLWELEEEEVKGFIDLGFKFDTENLSPRMISVVPGLQRLGGCNSNDDNEEGEVEGGVGMILRPYLSEAWLIKRPDSPLLNLRVPKESKVAEMKKHLKYWARTVASEIQQES